KRVNDYIPQCCMILYLEDITNLITSVKKNIYVTIHIGDDKGNKLCQSNGINNEYLSIILPKKLLSEIDDKILGPILTVRIWLRQSKIKRDHTIGKFTLKISELYETQLNREQTQFRSLFNNIIFDYNNKLDNKYMHNMNNTSNYHNYND